MPLGIPAVPGDFDELVVTCPVTGQPRAAHVFPVRERWGGYHVLDDVEGSCPCGPEDVDAEDVHEIPIWVHKPLTVIV